MCFAILVVYLPINDATAPPTLASLVGSATASVMAKAGAAHVPEEADAVLNGSKV